MHKPVGSHANLAHADALECTRKLKKPKVNKLSTYIGVGQLRNVSGTNIYARQHCIVFYKY